MSSRAFLIVCALLCGCEGGPSVGLGRFRVVATRGANTCGPQSGEFSQAVEFDVELSAGNGTLRWTPSGASGSTGSWSASLHAFRVLLEQDAVAWPADRRTETVGCTLRRTDVIEGTLTFDDRDAAASDASVDASADAAQLDASAQPDASSAQPDGGSAPVARAFTATETVVFGAAPGSDCRALVGAGSHQYNTMPCSVTYTLSGTRTGDNSASAPSGFTF
jgi:hypothetical protein